MRIKQVAGFTTLQVMLALLASLQGTRLDAQSTDLEAKRQEISQAKRIVQEIRAGNTPTTNELNLLDDVLSNFGSSLSEGPLAKAPAKQVSPPPEQKPAPALTVGFSETKTTSGIVYAYVVDPKSDALRCFWRDRYKVPYGNIESLREDLVEQGSELRFAINGGIYERDLHPKGLYVEQGSLISDLDKTHPGAKAGNFYLEPNGVFLIDARGVPRIVTTDRFTQEFPDSTKKSLRLAIQSGPALLVDGEINLQFSEYSQNRLRRSGVGVLPDGRIVFAITGNDVSFREFALFFKERGCTDALYLDGGPIPSFYVEKGPYLESSSDLVTMCGVVSMTANRNRLEGPPR